MRYPADHKEETRERIVHAASRRFRRSGSGVGIGQLMKALKLTHGGFYRHFRSKDELLAEALMKASDDVGARMSRAVQNAPPGRELEVMITTYLSEQHCADPAGGCPIAALAPEVARHSKVVRVAVERGLLQKAASVARVMRGGTEEERRNRALALISAMAGALSLARAVSDDTLRKTILEAARKNLIEAFARGR